MRSLYLFLLSTLAWSSLVQAQSLAERKRDEEIKTEFQTELKSLNEFCGSAMQGDIDFKSWAAPDAKGLSSRHCIDTGLAQIRMVCRDDGDIAKKAIKEKIKKFSCKFASRGKRSVTLSSGTLTYSPDKELRMDNFIYDYLREKAL